MPRTRRLAAAFLALATLLFSGAASAREDARVLVRFSPQLAGAEATRLASAMRAQLRDTAAVVTSGETADAVGVVDVERTEAGLVLRFADRAGNRLGSPRLVARGGEIGASEVAAIVRAFVIAAVEGEAPSSSSPAPAATTEPPAAAPAPEAPAAPAPVPLVVTPPMTSTATPASEHAEVPSKSARAAWRARVGAFYDGVLGEDRACDQ